MMLTEHDEPMPHLADKFDIEARIRSALTTEGEE